MKFMRKLSDSIRAGSGERFIYSTADIGSNENCVVVFFLLQHTSFVSLSVISNGISTREVVLIAKSLDSLFLALVPALMAVEAHNPRAGSDMSSGHLDITDHALRLKG